MAAATDRVMTAAPATARADRWEWAFPESAFSRGARDVLLLREDRNACSCS